MKRKLALLTAFTVLISLFQGAVTVNAVIGTSELSNINAAYCDVNRDGAVTVIDLIELTEIIIKSGAASDYDINGDGEVNVQDVIILKTWLSDDKPFSGNANIQPPEENPLVNTAIEQYNEVIDYVKYKFKKGDNPVEDTEFGYYWYDEKVHGYFDTGTSTAGYSIRDLNSDGIPELIFGTITNADNNTGSELGVVYSYYNDQIIGVVESWSRNRNTLLKDGFILHHASSGAANSESALYTIEPEFNIKYSWYVFTELSAGASTVQCYRNTTGKHDIKNSELITNYNMSETEEDYLKNSECIEFTPLFDQDDSGPDKYYPADLINMTAGEIGKVFYPYRISETGDYGGMTLTLTCASKYPYYDCLFNYNTKKTINSSDKPIAIYIKKGGYLTPEIYAGMNVKELFEKNNNIYYSLNLMEGALVLQLDVSEDTYAELKCANTGNVVSELFNGKPVFDTRLVDDKVRNYLEGKKSYISLISVKHK